MFYIIFVIYIGLIQGVVEQATKGPLLLYSTNKDIRITNTTKSSNNKIISTILVHNFTEDSAIDYHYEQKKICWTNHKLKSILCDDVEGEATKNKIKVINTGMDPPGGLTCDWFTNKLYYWTDGEIKRIEVITMENLYRNELFWTGIDQPSAIGLAPMKGWMFWTDHGEIPKIERAGMNGDSETRKVLVNTNISWPTGLSIDYKLERIYWIDGKLNFIEAMTYEGTNRATILKSDFKYPLALTMFQTKLFWTDWETWSIHSFDQSTNSFRDLIHHQDSIPLYTQVYDQSRQPKQSHPCEQNGGCSHLCLLAPTYPGYSCACPVGIKLLNNTTCAEGPQELLLLAGRTDIFLIHLDSFYYTRKTLPVKDIHYAIAIDFDPIDGFIYWSDDEVKKIQKARLNGSDQQDVVSSEIQHLHGIAIDWVARNIYWTDAGTDRVEVCRLKEKYRKVIIFDDLMEPRAIAVAPELGWLFWSDWYDKNPKVERANLDGSERRSIVTKNLGWPNGITLDLKKQRLFWCDAKMDRIEYSDMEGNHRRVLISENVPHVFGFTLMEDFLYWTDWQRRTISRAHKVTGRHREVILDKISNGMGLKAVKLGADFSGKNLCSVNNGGCSHFCFYRHNRTRVCACELGFELTNDRHTCVKPEIFLLYSKRNQIGMIGVENKNNEIAIPVTGINNCSSMDYDTSTMSVYWSDRGARAIMRAFLNGSNPQKVVDWGLGAPEGVAIDWLASNIYWTDPLAQRIEVARLPGSSRKTLLWEGKVSDPYSIGLDPPNGQMYWSEWGASKSIKKGAMDGSNIETLVTTKGYATQLTLDYDHRRLFWTEINTPVIWSVDLNGNDRKIIIKNNIFEPVGLTIFKDFIYWSDNQTGEILKTNKMDGSDRQVVHENCYNITDLQIYHSKNRRSTGVSNGDCKHLRLALPNLPEKGAKYVCACPNHDSLENNECIPPKQFMIYSLKTLVVRLLPSPTNCLEAALPIQGLKRVKAIDFDPVQRLLYWIEGKTHWIKRAHVTGTEISTFTPGKKELQIYDLAIDSLGRLIFWTSTQDTINVNHLDNYAHLGAVIQRSNEKPRLLTIHLTKRLLFYSDVGPKRQLVRTRLDGSHRLVITRNADIGAIAVDQENDWIVWSKEQSVYMSNIEGENQVVLVNDTATKATRLTILSGWLYWIDREFQLQRVELQSGKLSSPLPLQASQAIIDLIAVQEFDHNNPCFQNSTKCSHLCILNGPSPVCACPLGHVLKKDKRTCSAVQKCGPDRFTCVSVSADHENCIPLLWRCDGRNDCADGSDEIDCPQCAKNHFKCTDGSCISLNSVCDGISHCTDHSDEERCCTDGFRCPNTQVCLPWDLVCNDIDNCADGADEHHNYCKSVNKLKASSNGWIWAILGILLVVLLAAGVLYCYLKKPSANLRPRADNSLKPKLHRKFRKDIPDVVRMSMMTRSESGRNHIAGGSSTTESNFPCYPREPLNPPPSPATTRVISPYRYYTSINRAPPPTPCSTDVCEESGHEGGPFPPPPTPRSQCRSESSNSSTYFNACPTSPSTARGYEL